MRLEFIVAPGSPTAIARRNGRRAIDGEVPAIDSSPGVGTTVRLYLPRADADADREARDPDEPRGAAATETVLLVEDGTLVRMGVEHMLRGLGYRVVSAKDPGAAPQVLDSRGSSIDLLLTDVMLPGLSGPELASIATSAHGRLRVLFMSAFQGPELVAQGRIAPGTESLENPFSEEALAKMVRAALQRSD